MRHAFLLAVEQYKNFAPTGYCHSDATLLRETLTKYCDFAEQNVMTDLLSPASTEKPSDILARIEELVNNTKDGDTLLFFFAGHGHVDDDEPYLILPNTIRGDLERTALPLRSISALMRNPNRINIRIIDACHSGYDVRSGSEDSPDAAGFVRAIEHDQADGWITLAACRHDQQSYGSPDLQNGVYTHSICGAIKDFTEGDPISVTMLHEKTCARVREWTERTRLVQSPTLVAAFSGTPILAIRRSSEAQESEDRSLNEEQIRFTEGRDIQARLAAARGAAPLGIDRMKELLQSYIEDVRAAVDRITTTIDMYGCQFAITGPSSTQILPSAIESNVISFFERRKLKPVHDIRVEVRKSNTGIYGLDLMRPQERVNVVSNGAWPACCVEGDLESDGVVPRLGVTFYLVPLQSRACLLGFVTACDGIEGRCYLPGGFRYTFLDYADASTSNAIEDAVGTTFRDFMEQLNTLLEKRLDYIDHERQQA